MFETMFETRCEIPLSGMRDKVRDTPSPKGCRVQGDTDSDNELGQDKNKNRS